MRLTTKDPADRKLLARLKDPKTGKSLLSLQIETEKTTKQTKSKYRNIKFVGVDGEKWDSRWEYDAWFQLHHVAGVTELKRKHWVTFEHNGVRIARACFDYSFNFMYRDVNRFVVADAKSRHTAAMYKFLVQKNMMLAFEGIKVLSLIKEIGDVKKMLYEWAASCYDASTCSI